jgi:hypothetical protein
MQGVLYVFSEFSVASSRDWRRGFSQNGWAPASASQADAKILGNRIGVFIDDRLEARQNLRMQMQRVSVKVQRAQFLIKYINL